jgi:gamma-glutamyl:cysteine ligase YbdK (ATP-grasp superfamily)
MTALAANSPFLFGKELWDETRIPLFEQAVAVSTTPTEHQRVTFGSNFVEGDLLRPFQDNLEKHQVLLPILFDDPPEALAHLRLHNGTIWRWNRPLVCREPNGSYSLRLEHRVAAAGPTPVDCVANAAFFYGLAKFMIGRVQQLNQISFVEARENFYQAARQGLSARIDWPGLEKIRIDELLVNHLIPAAGQGLTELRLNEDEVAYYMALLEKRVKRQRNGAMWQKAFIGKYGPDWKALVKSYLEKQNTGTPVGDWNLL